MLDTSGSETDRLLSKAEPVSEAAGTLREKCLRRGKTCCVAIVRERNEAKNQQNSRPAGTKVNEEREGGGAPNTGAEVTLQPMEEAVLRQVVLLQPMEGHIRGDIHCARPHSEAGEQCDEEGQAESNCYMD